MTKTNAKLTIALIVVLALCLSLLMCSIFSGGTIIADAEGSDLQSMVDEIEEGGTITLSSNVVLTQALSITTTNSFTLDLNGYAISRSLDSAVVDGYVIYVASDATVTITSGTGSDDNYSANPGTITGGNNTDHGGGIYNAGTLTIDNIEISGNTSIDYNYGGGIYNAGTLQINDCIIKDNEAFIGGGIFNAYSEYGELTITSSTISGNTANSGGGISNGGTLTVDDCTIEYNSADMGGGVENYDAAVTIITDSIIRYNSASLYGGGLYINSVLEDPIYINGDTYITNNVVGGEITNNEGNYSLSGSNASNVYIDYVLDGVYIYYNISFDAQDPFTGEIGVTLASVDLQGENYYSTITTSWNDCHTGTVSSDNTSYSVVVTNSTLTLEEYFAATVTINGAVEYYSDFSTALTDALAAAGSTLTLLDNVTLNSAIVISTNMILDLNGYTIDRNLDEATASGYVISIGSSATVTITSGTDEDGNYSAGMGTITGGYNSNSDKTAAGGGICNQGTLYIYNISITGNTATKGGGIFSNGTLIMEYCSVTGNATTSGGSGGGMNVYSGTAEISNSTISSNTAGYGGGIYVYAGTVSICGSTAITYNTASTYGGGIYVYTGTVSIYGSTAITYNTASTYGGGIYVCTGTVSIYGSTTITGNTAKNGGGIFNNGGAVSIYGSTAIAYNTASTNGGGIYIAPNGTVYIYGNTEITHNTASTNGSGIYNDYCKLYIYGSTTVIGNVLGGLISSDGEGYTLSGGTTNNIYLSGTTIDFSGTDDEKIAFTGEIGVTLRLAGQFSSTWDYADASATVSSDNASRYVSASGSTASLVDCEASVTIDGAITYYATLAEAVTYANEYTAELSTSEVILITMLANVNTNAALEFTNTVNAITLQMAGFDINRGLSNSDAVDNGSVIIVSSGVTLTITSDATGAIITGGNTTDNGGGINNAGTLTINNITISGNKAINTTDETGKGGGIYSTGTLTVINSTISGNTAHRGGGMYILEGTVEIDSSTISSNTANFRGGGMYILDGSVSIIDSTISSNTASAGDNGGGIYVGDANSVTLTIGGSTSVNSNTCSDSASNIYLEESRTITFDDSDAFTGTVGVTMKTAGQFSSTWDTAYEGTVSSDSTSYAVLLSTTTNTGDTLTLGTELATVTIGYDVYSFGSLADAVSYANGYTEDNSDILITMLGNANTNATGALIFSNTTNAITLDMAGCTIDRGLTTAESSGYVIKVNENVTLTITSGTSTGAGTYSTTQGTITGGNNSSSKSSSSGGGINNAGTLTISNISISGNNADSGGGIYTYGETSITNSTITDNTASYCGGICIYSGTASITNSTISGNEGTSRSGGIEVWGSTTVIIDGCTISGNTAGSGGGGGIINYGTVVISNSTISGNTAATISGGGIFTYGTLYIYGSTTVTGNANSGTVSGDLSSGYTVTGGTTNNVYLYNTTIEFYNSEDSTGYSAFTGTVGVTMKTAGQFSSTWDSVGTGATVTSDSTSYAVLLSTTTNTGDTLALGTELASITIDGTTTYFGSLADAVSYANGYTDDILDGNGIVITMLDDADIAPGLIFSNTTNAITLDMAEHEIGIAMYEYTVISINSGATVTITSTDGSGEYSTTQGTITDGYNFGGGGGIFNEGTLTISNISITGNYASYGGGIYNNGTLTIINTEITGNYASYGGGIYSNGTLIIGGNTTVTGNTDTSGSTANNIYLAEGKTVEFDSSNPFTGSIGVTLSNGTGIVSNSWDSVGTGAAVTSDNTSYYLLLGSSDGSTLDTLSIGTATATVTIGDDVYSFDSLAAAVAYANGYTDEDNSDILITMLDSANITAGLTFSNTTNAITLDMAGFEINRGWDGISSTKTSSVITVSSGVTLTITSTDGSDEYSYNKGTITGGYTNNGGGIFNEGTLTITNIEISGNTASYNGGGIYSSGTLELDNVDIVGNTANSTSNGGGGIYNVSGTLIVIDSTITGNTASYNGGGIYVYAGTVELDNVDVVDNTAGTSGGGVYINAGTVDISNSTIADNTATDNYGGGMYVAVGTVQLDNVDITGNTAKHGGGAFISSGSNIEVTIENSSITFNTASGTGGGILSYNTLIVIDSTISNNTSGSTYNGGGIFNQGTLYIYGSTTVTGNVKGGTVGGDDEGGYTLSSGSANNIYIASGKTITFDDVDDNAFTGTIGVTMASTSDNISTTYGGTGTVSSDYTDYVVLATDTTLSLSYKYIVTIGDTVAQCNLLAAAVTKANNYSDDDTDILITMYDDAVITAGLTFYNTNNAITLQMNGFTINRGWDGSSDDMTSSVIIVTSGVTLTITSSTDGAIITGGYSSTYGGGIYNLGTLTISNISISGNKASTYGGGIYNDNGTLTIEDSEISDNTANNGGGIYSSVSSQVVSITNSTISGNTANYGGGIHCYGGFAVYGGEISDNYAKYYGGGIYNSLAELTLDGCTITGNTAGYDGGGICNYGTLTIEDATISDNTAGFDGGGIYTSGGSTVTIDSVNISGNTAGSNGGGICNDGGTVNMQHSTIQYNSARDGGGIYHNPFSIDMMMEIVEMDAYLTITDSTIQYNTASSDGGGIINNSQLIISGDTYVTGNVTGGEVSGNATEGYTLDGGSANNIYLHDSNYTITFSAFTGSIGVNMWSVGQFSTTYNNVDASATVTSDSVSRYVSASDSVASLVNYAVSVKINDTVTYYATLALAVTYANEYSYDDSDILITMLANADTDEALIFSNTNNTITLDMAGFEIDRGWDGSSSTKTSSIIIVNSNVALTITSTSGTGTISGGYATDGGGIYNSGTLIVSYVEISGNKASSCGGSIYNLGTLTVSYVEISDNHASSNGGGIYNSNGTVKLDYVVITGNTAGSSDYGGGGIYNYYYNTSKVSLSITNSTISDNTSYKYGGGVYIYSGVANITDSIITGNTASSYSGGGVYVNTATVTLDNVDISYNTAKNGGGVYVYDGILVLDNTDITYNTASNSGGGISSCEALTIYGNTTVTGNVLGGTVSGNSDDDNYSLEGSAANNIYLLDSIVFDDEDDNAFTGTIGMTMFTSTGDFSSTWDTAYEGTVFSDNAGYYVAVSDDGTTLTLAVASTTVTIGDDVYSFGSLADAVSYANGYTDEDNSDILITMLGDADTDEALIFSNTSNAITLDMAGYTIDRGLTGLDAVTNGYVIKVNSRTTVTITSNVATMGTITGGNNSNDYSTAGGGINNYGTLTISNVNITGNTAKYGGGINNYGSSADLTIEYSIISGNTANTIGGGVYNNDYAKLSINSSTITDNTADLNGGGVYIGSGTAYIYGSTTVTGNTAKYGGGIYSHNGALTIINSTISYNTASSGGGGIYVYGGTAYITDSTISYNTTSNVADGGGIYVYGGTLSIYGSTTVTGNVSGGTVSGDLSSGYTISGVTTNNIYLINGTTIVFSGTDDDKTAFTGAIGVTMAVTSGNISTTWDSADTGTVTSDRSSYRVNASADGTTLTLVFVSYVTFDSNGGSSTSTVVADINTAITAPDAPTYSGYTFVYWTDSTGAEFDFDTVIAEDITLTAKWALDSYSITYVVIPNITGTNSNATSYTVVDSDITLSDATVTGAIFLGWYDASGNQVTGIESGSFGNITLYAYYSVTAPSADSTEFVYNGSEQTYGISSTDLYTVSGNTQTDAGTHTVTVSLADNCYWADTTTDELTFDFVIAKATVSAAVDTDDLTYGGSAPTISTEFGTEEIWYTGTTNGGVAYSSPTAPTVAGDYTVTVTVAGTSDYDGIEESYDFTIERAAGSVEVIIDEDWTYGDTLGDVISYSTSTNDASDVVVEYRIYTMVRTMSLSTTTEWSTVAPTDAGTYEVRVTYSQTDNYYEVVYQNTFSIAQVSVEQVTPTATGITYGNTLADSALSGVASVDGSWSWDNSSIAPSVSDSGVTAYTAVFTPSDSVNYMGFTVEVTVTVAKATYDMSGVTFADLSVTYSGTAHTLAISGELPTGVSVSYTGNSNTEAGTYTVTASFSGDTDNYEAIADMTATVTITAVVVDDADNNEEETTSLWWIIAILSVIVVTEVIFIMKKLRKNKKNNSTRTYSAAPLALLLAVPMGETIAIAVLAVLAVVCGIVLAVLYIKGNHTEEAVVPTAKPKPIAVTPSGSVTKPIVEGTVAEQVTAAPQTRPVAVTSSVVVDTTVVDIAPVATASEQDSTPVQDGEGTVVQADSTVAEDNMPATETAQQEDVTVVIATVESAPVAIDATTEGVDTVVPGVMAMSKPKLASDDEVGFGGIDEVTGKAIIIRYSKSFTAKLIQSSDEIKQYYTVLKNALHSYNGVKSRLSWKYDSIVKGRVNLAKFAIKGKSLYLYLALDASQFDGTKYKVTASAAKLYEKTPCLYKVSGPRKLKYALELIAILATQHELSEGTVQNVDYYKPFETTAALLEQKLIKELISKKKYEQYMDKFGQHQTGERRIVSAQEVDSLMSTEQATAVLEQSTQQYTSEVASTTSSSSAIAATSSAVTYRVKGNVTAIVNVDTLSAKFADGDTVDLQSLKAKGLIAKNTASIKVLARGSCDKSLTVIAHQYSIQAVKMILLTGGTAIKTAKK